MKTLDRFLQQWRLRVATPWIPDGARVLDVGCHRGELFERIGKRLGQSVGIDPLAPQVENENWALLPLEFAGALPFKDGSFDCIAMLAVLEHIRDRNSLAAECKRLLRPGGRLVVTVPSPMVDRLLRVLETVKIIDGMSLDQHHGFRAAETPSVFLPSGFRLEHVGGFQLGANNLFVFSRDA